MAVVVTELGDPGKEITGEPSKEESRKLAKCWYQREVEAERGVRKEQPGKQQVRRGNGFRKLPAQSFQEVGTIFPSL